MTKTWCVGGRRCSESINQIIFKKVNPKTETIDKIIKRTCSICARKKSQIFTKQMTGGESFIKNAKRTHGHRSAESNSIWCDSNKNCTVLKLHEMCHDLRCNCQKQITFSAGQFQLEGNGFKNTIKKFLWDLKQLGLIF